MTDRIAAAHHTEDPVPPRHLKHCFVTDRHGRLPGLLLEWRQPEGEWEGYVVRAVLDENGEEWVMIAEWLPAGLLDPSTTA